MLLGEWKDKPLIGRKYVQIITLIKDVYPDDMKNSQNSIIRKHANQYHKKKKRAKDVNRYFTKENIWKDGK